MQRKSKTDLILESLEKINSRLDNIENDVSNINNRLSIIESEARKHGWNILLSK